MTPKPWCEVWKDYQAGRIQWKTAYALFMMTPEWAAISAQAKRRANWKCARNPSHPGPMETHHIVYTHAFDPLPEELEVLCEDCHASEHGLTLASRQMNFIFESVPMTDKVVPITPRHFQPLVIEFLELLRPKVLPFLDILEADLLDADVAVDDVRHDLETAINKLRWVVGRRNDLIRQLEMMIDALRELA